MHRFCKAGHLVTTIFKKIFEQPITVCLVKRLGLLGWIQVENLSTCDNILMEKYTVLFQVCLMLSYKKTIIL